MAAHRLAALVPLALLISCGSVVSPGVQGNGERTPSIVGGTLSQAFAATGSLYHQGHFCTATLVRQDHVLTAAHCLEDVPSNALGQVEFVLGSDVHGSPRRFRLAAAWLHPGYVKGDLTLGNDIALARLQAPVLGVLPVALHLGSPQALLGQQATLVGYGRSENDATQGIRRETQVVLDEVQAKKISYTFAGKGGCYGDSGGPMFVNVNGGWWQLGITSHGTTGTPNCQERAYYNRIDVHAGWLAQHGISSGDRPRECNGGNRCDGLCPSDPDCSFLWQGSSGPPPPSPPAPPAPPSEPSSLAGYGASCADDNQCYSGFCAGHPMGGGYCSWACDAYHPCPPGGSCYATQYPGLYICGPPGW